MARQTEESHFPSAMNMQDLLDLSNSIPEECATTLPKSNALRALAAINRAFPHVPNPKNLVNPSVPINFEDSLLTKVKSILNSEILADVTLVVGEERTVMYAHKLVLALASPVFTAMFYGEFAKDQSKGPTSNNAADDSAPGASQPSTITPPPKTHHSILPFYASVIEIPDCNPETMKAFLQYVYSNGTPDDHSIPSISVDDALSLLYTARKYSVRGLEDKCIVNLSSSITAENVFDILYAANFYSLSSLGYLCWEFVEDNPIEVVNTHLEFLTHETMQSILKKDKLNCEEVELFKVFVKWAEQECSKMKLEFSPENIRSLCGDELKLIRFPTMSGPQFADNVVPTGLLSVEQIAKIFTTINTSEERKKEQQQQQQLDPNFPSRSSVLLNGMEFSSQRRSPNVKLSSGTAQGQQQQGAVAASSSSAADNESLNRPPVFTFIAGQQIRSRDNHHHHHQQQQNQNHHYQQQQPVNNGGSNIIPGGAATQGAGNPTQIVASVAATHSVTNNDDVVINDLSDFALPGIVGIVPINVLSPPASVTQAGAGEIRGRTRHRQTRRSRRRGAGSSTTSGENQPT